MDEQWFYICTIFSSLVFTQHRPRRLDGAVRARVGGHKARHSPRASRRPKGGPRTILGGHVMVGTSSPLGPPARRRIRGQATARQRHGSSVSCGALWTRTEKRQERLPRPQHRTLPGRRRTRATAAPMRPQRAPRHDPGARPGGPNQGPSGGATGAPGGGPGSHGLLSPPSMLPPSTQ